MSERKHLSSSRLKRPHFNVWLVLLFFAVAMPVTDAHAPELGFEPSSDALPSWWPFGIQTSPHVQTASGSFAEPRAPASLPERRAAGDDRPASRDLGWFPQVRLPKLVITKQDDPDPVPAGGVLRYTITYTNLGNADARNVVITEFYDVRTIYRSAVPEPSIGNNVWLLDHPLYPRQGGSIVVEVQAENSTVAGTILTNVVRIDDPDAVLAVFTETTVVTRTPELTLTLNAQPNPVNAGGDLVYHIRYGNIGNAPFANAVLTMSYDEDVVFESSIPPAADGTDNEWHLGTLVPGTEGDVHVTVVVGEYLEDLDTLTSSAVVGGAGAVVSSTEQTLVYAPRLALNKTAAPDPVQASNPLTYTLVFSNYGHAATSDLEVTDVLPVGTDFLLCSGLPCTLSGGVVRWQMSGGLPPQNSMAVTLVVAAQRELDSGSVITNVARVAVIDAPYYAAQSQITTTVANSPSLWLTISDGQTSVAAGERLTYALSVLNTGSAAAYETSAVANPPPPELATDIACSPAAFCDVQSDKVLYAVGLVRGGEQRTVYLYATVRDPLPAGARSIVASAVVSTVTEGDPPEGNAAQDSDPISTRPDLIIKADYEDAMPWPGKHVTYTLHFSNVGHMVAAGVTVTATEPPHSAFEGEGSSPGWVSRGDGRYTYALGQMDFDQVDELRFVVLLAVASFTPETASFDANFEIFGEGGGTWDLFPGDNRFYAPLGVPNLVIDGVMVSPSVWGGDQGTLQATVRNTGTGPACGVYLPEVGCTPYALDVFIDPDAAPAAYPIEGFGDCYVFVDPIPPGLSTTVVLTFTHDSELQYQPGFCGTESIQDMWLKVDNWDPSADPYPAPYGLVPEFNELDNLYKPPSGGPRLYLPLFLLGS
jgi:uncharacterized repeat protein (TIGR01451 family)